MRQPVCLVAIGLTLLAAVACSDASKNAAVMGVDFEWQQIDKGSSDNPEIRLTGVPAGTKKFLVSLVDLNLNGFEHGSGFVDNDGSGIIARGSAKGSYGGPDPPYANMRHTYEITVKAYDDKGTLIGIGKKAQEFVYEDVMLAR